MTLRTPETIPACLTKLRASIERFNEFFQEKAKVDLTEREFVVIRHIAYLHPYYAKNLSALVAKKPQPLFTESSNVLYERSLKHLEEYDIPLLRRRIRRAEEEMERNALRLSPKTALYLYKKGGKKYPLMEYIDVIARHITRHVIELEKLRRREERGAGELSKRP